ncbi:MAG: BolA/IbaG family iron-sulfur metabolism protein [Thermoplasmatota archaeon]
MLADIIQSVVPDAEVHATDLGGGDHWYVVAIAASFEGQRSFQRQRPIMAAFAPHFQTGAIHALDLKCLTPAELAEKHGGNIPAPFHPHADGTKGMHPH